MHSKITKYPFDNYELLKLPNYIYLPIYNEYLLINSLLKSLYYGLPKLNLSYDYHWKNSKGQIHQSKISVSYIKYLKTKFYETFPKPDLLIYLQASPKQIFERVRKRGRTYEDSISLNYLEDVCEKYAEFFFNYSESPLLVLNVDNVDFMANKLDLARVIDCLKKEIVGKEFINLAPGFF